MPSCPNPARQAHHPAPTHQELLPLGTQPRQCGHALLPPATACGPARHGSRQEPGSLPALLESGWQGRELLRCAEACPLGCCARKEQPRLPGQVLPPAEPAAGRLARSAHAAGSNPARRLYGGQATSTQYRGSAARVTLPGHRCWAGRQAAHVEWRAGHHGRAVHRCVCSAMQVNASSRGLSLAAHL